MPFTINDAKPFLAEQAHKQTDASAGSEADLTLRRWIVRAIRYMQRFDFECWREEFSLTLTADDYQYQYTDTVWPTAALTRPLRFDGNSIRYADTYLQWVPTIHRLDERLGGPNWKQSGNGTPTLVTELSQGIIIGQRPSSSFVADYPLLRGYYYRGEDTTGSGFETTNLAMYDDFFEHLLSLSLVFALQQEDETEFQAMLQYWVRHDLVEMRGYDHVPVDDEPIPSPGWALWVEGSEHTF